MSESAVLYISNVCVTEKPTDRLTNQRMPPEVTRGAHLSRNKAGYTATLVACGWAGAVLEVTRASGQEPLSQNAKKVIVVKALDGQRYPLPLCEYM